MSTVKSWRGAASGLVVAGAVAALTAAGSTPTVEPVVAPISTAGLVVHGPLTSTPEGLTPSFIENHYDFDSLGDDRNGTPITGTGQTIAVVLWGNNEWAAKDLKVFISEFSLAPMLGLNGTACTPSAYKAEACFSILNYGGTTPSQSNGDDETAMDIEWAHVAAPGANITLVQAQMSGVLNNGKPYATPTDIDNAISLAATSGASVVSMSFGGPAMTPADAATWDGNSVAFVSGEGDDGFPETGFPPADANVLSVGGTNITPTGEDAWTLTGGGISGRVPRPGYQLNWTTTPDRTVNDVAYNAAGEASGAKPTYYSVVVKTPGHSIGWQQIGGVSAGIPQWAGIIADADQTRSSDGKGILARSGVMSSLYLAASDTNREPKGVIDQAYFTDVTTGCAYAYAKTPADPQPPCVADAKKGFDQLTGLGTPDVANLVDYLGYDV
jgi:subtilase family serine protease